MTTSGAAKQAMSAPRLWHEGRWWASSGTTGSSWRPVAQSSPTPACDAWSAPLPADERMAKRGAELLASSGGAPIVEPWPDGSLYLYTLDWGALAVRRCASPSLLGDSPPEPPPPVVVRSHPNGMAGLRESAAMIALAIARDMHDPKVIEWARQTIAQTGLKAPRGSQDNDEVMALLFARQKKELHFVKDPADTELMASAAQLLCLDPKGFCLRAGDCDDQLIVLGAAASTLGVPVRLLIRIYRGAYQGHVVLQYLALDPHGRGDEWHCMDPSVGTGRCSDLPTKEEFIVTIQTRRQDGHPTFIGLGSPPHALSEAGEASTLGADPASALSPEESAAWIKQLEATKVSLEDAYARLSTNRDAFERVRADLGLPDVDQPAANEATTGLSGVALYARTGAWTQKAKDDESRILATGAQLAQAIGEALAGQRPIYFNGGDVFVAAKPGDTFRVLLAPGPTQNGQPGPLVPTYFDANNQPAGTLGFLPIVIGAVIAIVSVASGYAIAHIMDYLAQAHHDDALSKISTTQAALVSSGAETPEQAQAQVAALTDLQRASVPPAKPGLFADLFSASPILSAGLIALAGAAGGVMLSRAFSAHAVYGRAA
jgi:hypothetical protein